MEEQQRRKEQRCKDEQQCSEEQHWRQYYNPWAYSLAQLWVSTPNVSSTIPPESQVIGFEEQYEESLKV